MSKKHTKEELENDPLLETVGKVNNFYQNNRIAILSVMVVLTVIVGSLIGYSFYAESQEERAQVLLAEAEQYYTEGDYQRALNGDDADFTLGMIQIADNFSGTDAGNLATYYASVSYFKLGQYEDALAYIKNYDNPKGILGVGSISYYATLLNQLERFEEAAEKFEKAAEWDVNENTTPYNLYKAAKAWEKAGNTERAAELVNRIIEEYPDFEQLGDVQRLKGMLASN
jgi:tetratricopeptide (TPR) repeat protein